MNKVYGIPVSPFVKRVIATLKLKNEQYEIDPITPFNKTEEFLEISHLGKIPAYKDENVKLFESRVICDYLDNKYPHNSIYPKDIVQKSLVLMLDDYAASKLFELLGAGIFYQRIIKPRFMNEESDEEKVSDTINNKLPKELAYLEQKLESKYIVGDSMTIADITIGALFLNATYAEYNIDSKKYPKLGAYLKNIFESKVFVEMIADDKKLMGAA